MKKHPATWLLAVLIVLGTGQAVPLSSLQGRRETCPVVQVAKARREQHIRRAHPTRICAHRRTAVSYSNDLPTVVRHFWSARLLRAPPLFSIA
jgi:hypothetical protein